MRVVLLIYFLFLSGLVLSQNTVKIKLKNGNKVEGSLLEIQNEDFIRLALYDDHVVKISFDQIYKMKYSRYSLNEVVEQQKKYYNFTSVGLIFIRTDYGLDGIDWNLHTLHGININHNYKVGLGVGLDRYGDISALPVYLGARGEFGLNHIAPTAYTNIGYGHIWVKNNRLEFTDIDEVSGGLFFELGGGITIRKPGTSISILLAYKHQVSSMSYSFIDWWVGMPNSFEENRQMRNIVLSIGFSF
jgi:hypothetical protein